MHFVIIATLLFLQLVFSRIYRQVTVCNETPKVIVKGDKGDTGNPGKAELERRRGETKSKGLKVKKNGCKENFVPWAHLKPT